jgi:adenylate cyclase
MLLFVAVALGGTGFGVVTYATGFLKQFERQTIDQRFSIRGVQAPDPRIVIVRMDTETFNELGVRNEYPRRLHAQVINRLKSYGAKVIAYDVQFTEPTDAANDNALAAAIGNAGNLVFATSEAINGQTNVLGGNANVRALHASIGHAHFPVDSDGLYRLMPYSTDGVASFGIAVAERYLGKPIPRSSFPGSSAWVDYAGPQETFPAVSFWQVLKGKVEPAMFRNKIVVVGPWAPTYQDIHPTPTTGTMPGVEIEANAVATALEGFPLRSSPTALNVFLIVLLGLLGPALGVRFGAKISTAGAVGAGALFAVAAQLAFNHGLIISFVSPLSALALSAIGALSAYYVVTAFEKERVRDVFSRFVPEGVVDQVLSHTGSDLRLGGKEMQVTVMFTDLRGFTSSVEHMSAPDVIKLLNHYLGEMSDGILAHGGTLITYMGDGIMAVFGAPIEQPDHADRSFAAARELLETRLPKFNVWMREQGLGVGYRMGVGLNSGPVMSGNVGHERRMEYTALGDTTNTASRIEGMTKGTPYQCFVAESTYELLSNPPLDLKYVDEVEVRGRVQKLKLWGFEPAAASAPEPAAAPAPEVAPQAEPA